MLEINTNTVLFRLEADDSTQVIHALADALHSQGYVEAEYGKLTVEREANHPTGLPTTPFPIAFPHAEAYCVNCSSLGIALLKNPVIFKNMADPEEDLQVELVFMLANASPEEQVQTLRNLATLFGQPEKLDELRRLKSQESIAEWMKKELALVKFPEDQEKEDSAIR